MTMAWKKSRPKWSIFDWLIWLTGTVLLIGGLFGWQFYSSYRTFEVVSDLSVLELLTLYRESQRLPLQNDDGHVNVLILGTDELAGRGESAPLTDTIIILSLDLNTNQVRLLPIPRDIYLPELGTKINAIYANYLTNERSLTNNAQEETRKTLEKWLEIRLHYSLIVKMQDVKDFLRLIGGVEVTIATGFVDTQFPREGVDVTVVRDPNLLYETVEFQAGETYLDADDALKFVRSRHAGGTEGNDYARSARQQLVLTAAGQKVGAMLLEELKGYDFTFLAQLYNFYQERFAAQIPFVDVLAYGQHFLRQGRLPEVQSVHLAISPGEAGANLLEVEGRDVWSLQITDYRGLVQEIRTKLQLQ